MQNKIAFVKQVFVAVLSLGRLLTSQNIKCIPINNEPYLPRLGLTDPNPNKVCYYPLLLNLNWCAVIYNALDDLPENDSYSLK